MSVGENKLWTGSMSSSDRPVSEPSPTAMRARPGRSMGVSETCRGVDLASRFGMGAGDGYAKVAGLSKRQVWANHLLVRNGLAEKAKKPKAAPCSRRRRPIR